MAVSKSASAPTLAAAVGGSTVAFKSIDSAIDFTKFTQRDREQLKSCAHSVSRKTLRALSFPKASHGATRKMQGHQQAHVAEKACENPTEKTAVAIRLAPLDFALGRGPEAEMAQNYVFEHRKKMCEDTATEVVKSGGSLRWLENDALHSELMEKAEAALNEPESARWSYHSQRNTLEAGVVPAGDVILATGALGVGVRSKRAKQRPKLMENRWPTIGRFEHYYHVPEELQPRPPSPKFKDPEPLPPGRESIARLEDSTSSGVQSFIYWQYLRNKEQEETASMNQRPWSGKAVGMFEAGAIFRHACAQLGVSPQEVMMPRPVFSERMEVLSDVTVSTKQCYAFAEALRACMPTHLTFRDVLFTDMGAAKIVETAIMTGRLQNLTIVGTSLSYRFCSALYAALRLRHGNSLTDLTLQGCGLGNHLAVELSELPPLVATAYSKGVAALPEGVIDPAVVSEDAEADTECPPGASSELPPMLDFLPEKHTSEKRLDEERSRKKQEHPRKSLADSDLDDRDQEAEEEPNQSEVQEPSWWDLEREPSRRIPVALPLILHLARPGCAIRRLDLSATALSLEMGRCLGWALMNSPMEALVLDKCCLNDQSLSCLTEGLLQNSFLQELSLRCNSLSGAPGPVNALIHTAGRHATLAHLDFSENPIHRDCIFELTALMQYSCSVLAMHILGEGVGSKDSLMVARACRSWVEENMKRKVFCGDDVKEDSEEDTFGEDEEELILCRARHVDELTDWRITSPIMRTKKPQGTASYDKTEVITAPPSWMPRGCWICKKCSTVRFRYVVPDRGEGEESGSRGSRLFLRSSFADYARVELQREQSSECKRVAFCCEVLVPPGSHNYVFESVSPNRKKNLLLHARDQPSTEPTTISDCSEYQLFELCKEYTYGGKVNMLAPVKDIDFHIPEHLECEPKVKQEVDPWAENPKRQQALRECYEADLPMVHLDEICHIEEEDEVREAIWELYGQLYDTYSIYAGRSLWPRIRQVDVYSFFEEADLLDRGPLADDGLRQSTPNASSSPDLRKLMAEQSNSPTSKQSSGALPQVAPTGGKAKDDGKNVSDTSSVTRCLPRFLEARSHPLTTQDVQQMIVQTITRRKSQLSSDASWLTRRKFAVVQRTREGAPITRAQFVEVLLRAAVALRGREPSTSGALRNFGQNILAGRIMQPPLSPFPRGLALQACVVRDTLLARRKSLLDAYERFGSNETSFQRLAQLLKLCDRCFTAKHVSSIYALSRRPMKHPSVQSSETGLLFDEFSEAVCRLALIWQPTVGIGSVASPQSKRPWPPQPQVGCPVKQQVVANRLEAFLGRLADRMRPAVVSNPSFS